MFEDKVAIVQVHDWHCIDIYVNKETYNALLKMERTNNNDGIAFRCKEWDPPSVESPVGDVMKIFEGVGFRFGGSKEDAKMESDVEDELARYFGLGER